MPYVRTGLTNDGVTPHYNFSYDDALAGPGGPEPARTNAVIAACEGDYNLMSGWFGGGLTVTGMSVQVTTQSNGASWSGGSSSSTIQLKAQGASYSNDPAYLRYLLIAEVTEIFMMTQNRGWFQGSDEGSKGEGLSRFLSSQFLAQNGFLGVGIDANYAIADVWLNSTRQDFVNNAPDDHGYNATNGCTTLFIYYLFHQLGFSINQIVGAGAATLAGVYQNLTSDPNNPFPVFKQLLDSRFPSQTSSAVPGPNFDDPWPLGAVSYAGVWRAGTGAYGLWINADQASFLAKVSEWAAQSLRLVDFEVSTVNGQQLWSGIWEGGTDTYGLWINADQASFLAKWNEWAAQNLRLVSIRKYDGLWAGVWRSGTDAYGLWIDSNESSFLAKWGGWAGQNLRLIDLVTTTAGGASQARLVTASAGEGGVGGASAPHGVHLGRSSAGEGGVGGASAPHGVHLGRSSAGEGGVGGASAPHGVHLGRSSAGEGGVGGASAPHGVHLGRSSAGEGGVGGASAPHGVHLGRSSGGEGGVGN
jgi:hypothetical protein